LAPAPSNLSRARGDLRMGVPVVLVGDGGACACRGGRDAGPGAAGGPAALGAPELALTARRAETLKARAYDGDLVRIEVPPGTGLDWLRALADPATICVCR
jgi:GTP cyclohydrolase II